MLLAHRALVPKAQQQTHAHCRRATVLCSSYVWSDCITHHASHPTTTTTHTLKVRSALHGVRWHTSMPVWFEGQRLGQTTACVNQAGLQIYNATSAGLDSIAK
eukprot:1157024-Pelagomonas_calceolata.AAC.5